MTQETLQNSTGIKLFNEYLANHSEDAKTSQTNDSYYHVDIVAEAYGQGLNDGKNLGRKDFLEKVMKSSADRFAQKANQVYICTKKTQSFLDQNGYTVQSFHINIFHSNPKVIIAVSNELLLNDEFVELAYTKIHEVKCAFKELFDSTLDMGLIGSDNIDLELLGQDGFEFSEEV
ncbi:hypothetical protein [Flavobacterium poyangense]|uniref:hypothetical protein n=1 Tax=Flavobacterium poyangense TaxID=2204302 RepID=UPI00141E42B5|nr:hypothetical protein [Flavobacterium sp. JXAS1]